MPWHIEAGLVAAWNEEQAELRDDDDSQPIVRDMTNAKDLNAMFGR